MTKVQYSCPACRLVLEEKDNCHICTACNKSWKNEEAIPIFSDNMFYWNHIPKDEMDYINSYAFEKGYKNSLKELLLKKTNSYIYHLAADESRADFSVLFDLDQKSKVLDIGCNWGAISMGLARRCGELHAIDCIMESLKFLKIRAQQEGLKNIFLAQVEPLDYAKLPFADSYFDVAVLNGVLEWIGSARLDRPVKDVRTQALQEIKRVLKPGGKLYIAIENRYSLLYLLGATDHHGLPFTSILPRFISILLLRLLKKREYRTYTHSFYGYKKFLRNIGFENITIHLPIPTYHKPSFLISLESPGPLNFFLSTMLKKNDSPSKKRQLIIAIASRLKFLTVYRIFAPSFGIVAEVSK